MPISLGFFLWTAIFVGLQLIPFVGLTLMFVAAPFWPIFTLNAGFVGVAIEALARRNVSRLWLVLPIVWFGGYMAWAAYEQVMVARTVTATRAANASRMAPLSSKLDADLLLDDSGDATGGMIARALLQQYDLSVIYVGDPKSPVSQRAVRIAPKALCDSVPRDRLTSGIRRADPSIGALDASNGACVLSMPETADASVIIARFGSRWNEQASMGLTFTPVRLSLPAGDEIELTTGRVQSLGWFPKPIIGCALNSDWADWQCFARFDRQRARNLFTDTATTDDIGPVLADALKMKPRSTEPIVADQAVVARIDTAMVQAVADARLSLQSSLANPDEDLDLKARFTLVKRPDIVAVYAASLAAAVQQEFAQPRNPPRSQAYQHLLSVLPDGDFERIRPRLDPLYPIDRELRYDQASTDLAARLGRNLRHLPPDFPGQSRRVMVIETTALEPTVKR